MVGGLVSGSFLASILSWLVWVFVVLAAAAIAAGVGLLDYEPWARPLAVAVCVLALVNFPVGTLLGIYGLWTLLSAAGEQHYREALAARGY